MSNRQTHRPTQSGPAQLDAGLLVRKGAALPASYRATSTAAMAPVPTHSPSAAPDPAAETGAQSETRKSPLPPAPKPPARNAATQRPAGKPADKTAGSNRPGERARISIRLDHDRHLRLRIAAAHLDRSLQDIMTDALDRYLDEAAPDVAGGNCECLTVPPIAASHSGSTGERVTGEDR